MDAEKKLYIIGAGFAGRTLASDIKRKKIFGTVSAFLDDDAELIGKTLDGITVFGPIKNIASILRFKKQDEAIIAIPSASTERIREIYESLSLAGVPKIKILPSISQVVDGDAHLIQTRDINALDILGRTPVTVPLKQALSYLRGKRVLITGAGGSIGSELSRQLLSGGAERLYLLGHGENSIYQIHKELSILQREGVGERATVVPIIGDLVDRPFVNYIMEKTKAEVVFHCAAYKHVPLMEENPVAVTENNVFGTKNLLDAALSARVNRFVFISTDKAVHPTSFYGASKMIGEHLTLSMSRKGASSTSNFMFVRFANVLGSRGSILPLFTEQIRTGGPLTITTKGMERYFMTIPEACSLVLRAGGVGENGHAYLLDMGKPIKIVELAKQIIRFYGLVPEKDIEIRFIGKRLGEREREPLWAKEEKPRKTKYEKILELSTHPAPNEVLDTLISSLSDVCFFNETHDDLYRNREHLERIISNFTKNF